MHEMVNYAKPQIEKLLLTQRKQAVDAINKATSDIQQQYDKALYRRTKQITAATAASFLKAPLGSYGLFNAIKGFLLVYIY